LRNIQKITPKRLALGRLAKHLVREKQRSK
jgi:hypothetical protein